MDQAKLQACFEAQRAAFQREMPDYARRRDALRLLDRALVRHKEDLISAISDDFGGRAAEETLALELVPTLNEIRHAISNLERWMKPRRARVSWQFQPARGEVWYQPLGIVGILSAWNFPLFLSYVPVANALAAGNHVMLKPSEFAPCAAELLRSIAAELYAPDYVSVVLGEAETGSKFSRLPFDHLLYTGSGRVAKEVMRAASENLTPVTLELGGKSPAIVHPDYPLRRAVQRILPGKLYNAGQTCVAPDYVLLPRNREAQFVELAREIHHRMYPRLAANVDYTRIINLRHYERLEGLLEDAERKGAKVIRLNPAQEKCDQSNRVFPPALITDVTEDMTVMQEEIFGPLLPIVPYETLDEAIEYVNARPHPLALYYFDENGGRVRHVLERTRAGGVTVNDCLFHVGQCTLPFGGVGSSGMGRYHGFNGFETFSNKQGVLLQSRWTALSLLRPPYGNAARRMLKFIVGA